MSDSHQNAVNQLIFQLSKLPGVGEKTATRFAYHILRQDKQYSESLAAALLNCKNNIQLCSTCFTFTEINPCQICRQIEFNHAQLLCIVENPSDVHLIEKSNPKQMRYHVLHGALSPMDGIGPDQIKIKELIEKISLDQSSSQQIKEVVLATNVTVEGDATAYYLKKILKPFSVKVTRLALGLPNGSLIEFTDSKTLSRAIANRTELEL